MRIGSLFSGAGGLDMAVQTVFGGEVVWHSEIDKAASKVLAHRYPDVPNLGDITEVNWANWKPMLEVDVLCGGFPCQDVSAAGRRAGIKDGTRSGLWAVFAEAIDQLRPQFVVIENVRGLLSATAHRNVESGDAALGIGGRRPVLRAAGAVLGDLADLGYDAVWATVAASDVGAPHQRQRVFILGTFPHTGHDAGCAEQRVEHEMQAPRLGESSGRVSGDELGVALLPTPTTQDGSNNGGPSQFQRNTLPLNAEVTLLPTPTKSDGTGGGRRSLRADRPHTDDSLRDAVCSPVAEQWGRYAPAIARWEALTRPAPAPTEPNKDGNPRLSAPFSEWLMGWPAGWVTDPAIGISRNDQLKICGNGVVPQQAAAALQHLLAVTG